MRLSSIYSYDTLPCYWVYRCFLNSLLGVLIYLNVLAARELLKAGRYYACVCEYIYCSHYAVWHLITGVFVLVWSVGRDLFSLWNRHQKIVWCNVISPNDTPLCYHRGKCPITRREKRFFALLSSKGHLDWFNHAKQITKRKKKENQVSKASLLPWEVRAFADFVVNFKWQQICSLPFKAWSSHVCNFQLLDLKQPKQSQLPRESEFLSLAQSCVLLNWPMNSAPFAKRRAQSLLITGGRKLLFDPLLAASSVPASCYLTGTAKNQQPNTTPGLCNLKASARAALPPEPGYQLLIPNAAANL